MLQVKVKNFSLQRDFFFLTNWNLSVNNFILHTSLWIFLLWIFFYSFICSEVLRALHIYRLLIIKNWLRLFICIWVKKCVFDDVKFHFLPSFSLTFYWRLIFVTCLLPRTAHIYIDNIVYVMEAMCAKFIAERKNTIWPSMRLLSFNGVRRKLTEVISKWELQIFVTCHFKCSLAGWFVFFLSFWCDHKKSCWWFTIKITKEHLKREILWIYLLFSINTAWK